MGAYSNVLFIEENRIVVKRSTEEVSVSSRPCLSKWLMRAQATLVEG